jgi:hypothetical protein
MLDIEVSIARTNRCPANYLGFIKCIYLGRFISKIKILAVIESFKTPKRHDRTLKVAVESEIAMILGFLGNLRPKFVDGDHGNPLKFCVTSGYGPITSH